VEGLFVLFEGLLEEDGELSLQFRTAEDLGIRAEGGDFVHGPEHGRGPTLDYSAAVFQGLDGCPVVGDYGLAVSGECILGEPDPGRLEGVSMHLWGELLREQPGLVDAVDPELRDPALLTFVGEQAVGTLDLGDAHGLDGLQRTEPERRLK
jgi:hypothetical protein